MSTWVALLGVIWLVVFIATWACMRAASISDRKHEDALRRRFEAGRRLR